MQITEPIISVTAPICGSEDILRKSEVPVGSSHFSSLQLHCYVFMKMQLSKAGTSQTVFFYLLSSECWERWRVQVVLFQSCWSFSSIATAFRMRTDVMATSEIMWLKVSSTPRDPGMKVEFMRLSLMLQCAVHQRLRVPLCNNVLRSLSHMMQYCF